MKSRHQTSPTKLSHVRTSGEVSMVDVTLKPVHFRVAVASGLIRMRPQTLTLIKKQRLVKGNIWTTARIAGILAAKKLVI